MLTFNTNLALHQEPHARVDFHNTVVTESGLDMSRAEFTNVIESVLDGEDADYKARTLVRRLEGSIALHESWSRDYPEDPEWGKMPWDLEFLTEDEYHNVIGVLVDYGAVYEINQERVYAVPYKMGITPVIKLTTRSKRGQVVVDRHVQKDDFKIAQLTEANKTTATIREFALKYGDASGGESAVKAADYADKVNAHWNEPKAEVKTAPPAPKAEVKAPKTTPKLDALFTKLASF